MCYTVTFCMHLFIWRIHLHLFSCRTAPEQASYNPLCPDAQPSALTFIFSTESLWVWVLDNFLMISAPVTGPEEALAGGGRLAVPSRSIVCSLTVAAPKQTAFLIYIYLESQDYLLSGIVICKQSWTSKYWHTPTQCCLICRQVRTPQTEVCWVLFNNPSVSA